MASEKVLNLTYHQGNANQNYHEIPPYPLRMAIVKNQKITSASKDGQKGNPEHPTGGNVNWYITWRFLKN